MSEISNVITKRNLVNIVRRGLGVSEDLITLSSGIESHTYIDMGLALGRGAHLESVNAAIADVAWPFTAVGGMSMGADPLAHGIAQLMHTKWFSIRKAAKEYAQFSEWEGETLHSDDEVLLVEDVTTTGKSFERALRRVRETPANVAIAVAVVDRGEGTKKFFESQGVPYKALVTYKDLGIEPV